MGLTAVGLNLSWKVLAPFLSILLWAAVLVMMFWPIHRFLLRRMKGHDSLASFLSTILVLATIILPVAGLTTAMVAEVQGASTGIRGGLNQLMNHPFVVERLPALLSRLQTITGVTPESLRQSLETAASTVSNWAIQSTVNVVGGALGFLVNLGLVSFTMFYLFRDGRQAVAVLREWIPLNRNDSAVLIQRAGDIISASVYGVVVIAVVQGALGGLAFWFLGLPSPLLWGVVMVVMSTVPMLGSFVVWVPAALYLLVTKAFGKALILTLWGTLVVGSADNLLRPILVGQRARMHELLIFFSVLGGLQLFGVLGILMGPVVLAMTLILLEAFRRVDLASTDALMSENPEVSLVPTPDDADTAPLLNDEDGAMSKPRAASEAAAEQAAASASPPAKSEASTPEAAPELQTPEATPPA